MKRLIWVITSLVVFAACSGKKPSTERINELTNNDPQEDVGGPSVDPELLNDLINQIPSPLEVSTALKESGAEFTSSYLNDAENVSKYNSNFSKALNLGIYGTDLGYCNLYEVNQEAIFYLNSIRTLADELNIGQFFDFSTIKTLATQSSNLDSLLLVTTQNFNDINKHLQEKKRSSLSVLLLAGGWLEAMHILGSVAEDKPNDQLTEKLAEQGVVLDNILFLLEQFSGNSIYIKNLHGDFTRLKEAYDQVTVEVIAGKPEYKIDDDGMVQIIDTTKTVVKATPEQIANIINTISEIRNKVIQ